MSSSPSSPSPESVIQAISARVGRDVSGAIEAMFRGSRNPLVGLNRLSHLMEAQPNPGVVFAQLESVPPLARVLGLILSTSQHLSDVLIQNPTFVHEVISPEVVAAPIQRETILAEAEGLLNHTISYAHQLDRLRLLKQRFTLRLAAHDLGNLSDQESIWEGLTTLALTILEISRDVVWRHFASSRGLPEECPLSVTAMGKAGGKELNYSSDIDLVMILRDDADESLEKAATKFAEQWRAALSDRMGRGDLYRVDLRLRPFGTQGPLVSRMRVVESYYARYAESWEHLALIRSVVVEDEDIRARWESMRVSTIFRGSRSEKLIGDLLSMRQRLEGLTHEGDLKRGPGGIRDIEFLVQIQQMLLGDRVESARIRGTLPALRALRSAAALSEAEEAALAEGYRFLRQLEHRCQIVGNTQTHELPRDEQILEAIAESLGTTGVGLKRSLDAIRRQIREIYSSAFGDLMPGGRSAAQFEWIRIAPHGETLLRQISQNETSAARLEVLTREAPALLSQLGQATGILEQVMSGEILEPQEPGQRFAPMLRRYEPAPMAKLIRGGWLRAVARWALEPSLDLSQELADLADAAIRVLVRDSGVSVIAVGSLGAREGSLGSDGDIIIFSNDFVDVSAREKWARHLLQEVRSLRTLGSPLSIDLRLRPEGSSGPLVASMQGFVRYAAEQMDPWERFALGRARLICGDETALREIHHAAYGFSLDADGFASLRAMKRRIESERVSPALRNRHIKLGTGAMDDILWLVQIGLMSLAGSAEAEKLPLRVQERLIWLEERSWISPSNLTTLTTAWQFLTHLRHRLGLIGISDDVMTENPEKLGRLAPHFGHSDPNELLREFESHLAAVRSVFDTTMESHAR
jgi:[glutamine synthetase] adenylyltransferase / [glutamine synthetase]-adenylyl-L-tyrosine phosphorylase